MSNRFDNRRLSYILTGLIIILALTVLIKIPKEKATLKEKIVEFDSAEVSRIVLYPKRSIEKPVEFFKSNGRWNVQQGTIVSASRKEEVENIIIEILSIKPQNLVARNKSKWTDYQVTDSTGTRITILNKKGKTLADLVVGRFSYKQVNSQMNMYGRNNIQGTSYIRLSEEDEVYGVDGFLSLSFNRTFNDWRDNTLITLKKDDITRIKFTYPSDTSFTLEKKETVWTIDNRPADSSGVARYLTSLSNIDGQDFNDAFKPDMNPDYQLVIEGNNLLNISVRGYKHSTGDYVINSSQNPDIYFSSKMDGVFSRVFKSEKDFLPVN